MPAVTGLSPQEVVGRYRILEALDSGGMGQIYKAEDTTLGRCVAIKVVAESLASDPISLERFRREAQTVSALNHPNICTLYDIGEHNGRTFLAMEYLEGHTLATRVMQGPLPIDEIVEIAMQVADALETAHELGIVHRDIKTANIFLTAKNQVKLLDFGLARVEHPLQVGASATTAMNPDHLTSPGVAVGTVAYMSPEQIMGKPLDPRTDLFSFGVVLYELATRVCPFRGQTSGAIFDSILHDPPTPVMRLNADLPPELEGIINKALEKDRELRYQSAAEIKADLKRLRRDSSSAHIETMQARRRRNWARWAIAACAAFVVAGIFVGIILRRAPKIAPQGEWVPLTDFSDSAVQPALSPDGKMLAFIRGGNAFLARGQVYVKMLPDGEPVQLTHDGLRKMAPTFSPDGNRIAYTVIDEKFNWNTYVVPVLGGEPQLLLPNAEALTWIGNKQIMFSEIPSGIHMLLVTATESRTGRREIYVPPTERGMAHHSALSPDKRSVLMTEMGSAGEWMRCRLVPFDGSNAGVQVGPNEGRCLGVAWSPDGRWMYMNVDAGNGFHIWRQRSANQEAEQITFGPEEQAGVAASPDGLSLVTASGLYRSTVWIHRPGQEDREISSQGDSALPQFSPDGKTLYFLRVTDPKKRDRHLMAVDLETMRVESLFPNLRVDTYDISPDGKRVAFASWAGNRNSTVWVAELDRRTAPQQIPAPVSLDSPQFAANDELFVRAQESGKLMLQRCKIDGSNRHNLISTPIVYLQKASPHADWLIVMETVGPEGHTTLRTTAYAADGKSSMLVCDYCVVNWAPNEKTVFFTYMFGAGNAGLTISMPLAAGKLFPAIPAGGLSYGDAMNLPGVNVMERPIAPSKVAEVYAYEKVTAQRNIFRIPFK